MDAVKAPYRITKFYIGEVSDTCDVCELSKTRNVLRKDLAFELVGDVLHLFALDIRRVKNT